MKNRRCSKIPIAFFILCMCWLPACEVDPEIKDPCETMLFGIPISKTGLSRDVCQPTCPCKNYTPKVFRIDELQSLRSWTLITPFDELNNDPYQDSLPERAEAVCAVVIEDLAKKHYRLENFPDEKSAKDAGAILTHFGPCGLCSTLQDLAMYLGYLDLGSPVRQCVIQNFVSPFESLVSCIEELGFSSPCAQIWAFNARNTQRHCFEYCISDTTYNLDDGNLSPCLDCDERISGPVFKAVAGRTRRNSGIAAAICRPCTDVKPVAHDYPF